jgi:predicted kinase
MLVQFAGPPCSGKSTLAADLAARTGWPHLSMDGTRARILPDAAHTRADRAAAYRAMHFAADLLLRAGASVILDAPYGHAEDREEVARILAATGARWKYIECRVSLTGALRRFHARVPDAVRLDLNAEAVERLVREYPYTEDGLVLDTEEIAPEECKRRIAQFCDLTGAQQLFS